MNIKFTDQETFNLLYTNSIVRVEFGSILYGLNDQHSDTDIMCVYSDTLFERTSIFTNHHQFQYKDIENNTDYIFTSLSNFISNIISGDSTINFEIINSNLLINTPLEFLYENRFFFYTYNIIKSYLGLAKRDIEKINKQPSERDKTKALIHAIRGYTFARYIYNGDEFNLNLSVLKEHFNQSVKERNYWCTEYLSRISELRMLVSSNVNNLTRVMDVENQFLIDDFLSKFNPTFTFPRILQKEIYISNEIGIIY